MKKSLIGAHVSFLKKTQLLGTVKDLVSIGATSGAIYISDSRAFRKSYELDKNIIKEAHVYAKEHKFNIENIIVHAPMVGNIANTDKKSNTYKDTVKSYTTDVKRLKQAGIKYFNFHPGSNVDSKAGIKACARGINKIISSTKKDNTILLIETMADKGNYIGKTFEEISEIISLVKDKSRIGVCMDTCHVWDAGYDIKKDLKGVLKSFDKTIGLKYLKALHINDSKNKLGSGKDRHESIGKGYIGLKALKDIMNHPKLRNLPKALETPYGKDDFTRWSKEIQKLLK